MKKNHTDRLPAKFTRNITGLHGAKGERWLAELPRTVEAMLDKWGLNIERVFPNLSYNFVASCADETGEKLVLKIGHVGLQVIYAESHSFPASAVANGPSARSRRLAVLDGKPSVCDRADGARDSCGFQ